jgi:hypothetical protein
MNLEALGGKGMAGELAPGCMRKQISVAVASPWPWHRFLGGAVMSEKRTGYYPALGALINSYIDNENSFEVLENYIISAANTVDADAELLKVILHVLNHFDLDKEIMASDPRYAEWALNSLRELADGLESGSPECIWQKAKRCLGAK